MDSSPLARLPAELLNDVARLALVDGEPVKLVARDGISPVYEKASCPGLALACKALHKTYMPLVYSTRNFVLAIPRATRRSTITSQFIKQIGPSNAAALKKITIRVDLSVGSPCFRKTFAEVINEASKAMAAKGGSKARLMVDTGDKRGSSVCFEDVTDMARSWNKVLEELRHTSIDAWLNWHMIRRETECNARTNALTAQTYSEATAALLNDEEPEEKLSGDITCDRRL